MLLMYGNASDLQIRRHGTQEPQGTIRFEYAVSLLHRVRRIQSTRGPALPPRTFVSGKRAQLRSMQMRETRALLRQKNGRKVHKLFKQ